MKLYKKQLPILNTIYTNNMNSSVHKRRSEKIRHHKNNTSPNILYFFLIVGDKIRFIFLL